MACHDCNDTGWIYAKDRESVYPCELCNSWNPGDISEGHVSAFGLLTLPDIDDRTHEEIMKRIDKGFVFKKCLECKGEYCGSRQDICPVCAGIRQKSSELRRCSCNNDGFTFSDGAYVACRIHGKLKPKVFEVLSASLLPPNHLRKYFRGKRKKAIAEKISEWLLTTKGVCLLSSNDQNLASIYAVGMLVRAVIERNARSPVWFNSADLLRAVLSPDVTPLREKWNWIIDDPEASELVIIDGFPGGLSQRATETLGNLIGQLHSAVPSLLITTNMPSKQNLSRYPCIAAANEIKIQ